MRVDDWDEGDETPPRAPESAVEVAAEEPVAAAEMAPGAQEQAVESRMTLREAARRSPLWLWLIAFFTIGSMCVMFLTIMLLLALR